MGANFQDAPFGWLRHESGVHRVQRIPVTERKGRMQTSSVAVVLLPVAEEAAPCQRNIVLGCPRKLGSMGYNPNILIYK